jgi:hypothetical protein
VTLAVAAGALAVTLTVAISKALYVVAESVAHWHLRRQQRTGALASTVAQPPVTSWLLGWGAAAGIVLVVVLMAGTLTSLAHSGQQDQTAQTNVLAQTPFVFPTDAPTATLPPQPTNTPLPPTATSIPLNCHTAGAPCNPWGYTFANSGHYIYNPPSAFCDYFNCIASFWDHTNGYVDECADGTYSHSGGVRGACSSHGGERRPLFAP